MATTRIRRLPSPGLPSRLRPRKEAQQQRSVELVAALVEAGSRILKTRSWEAFTMQEVAKVAGVSPGSLYQYFADRTALLAAIIEAISQRELQGQLSCMASLPRDAALADKIEAMIREVFDFRQREDGLLEAALAALPEIGRHQLLVQRVRIASQAFVEMLRPEPVFANLAERETCAHVIVNAVHSLTHDGVLACPGHLSPQELTREIICLVRGYLRERFGIGLA